MPETTTTTGTIIDHLTADHQQIKVLFSDVMFVRPENRADTFRQLVAGLVQHEVAEEMVVYPEVRAAAGDEAAVVEPRLREQAEAEQMLAQMQSLDTRTPEFTAALTELSIAVINHAEAEERAVFPLLRSAGDPHKLFELGTRYERAKQSAPTHPHPHAPDTPPANKVLGPVTALFDRARDAVRRIA
jgi:hemerythrin superfamily protein